MAWATIGKGMCDHCADDTWLWDVSSALPGQKWCMDCIREKAE